LSVSPVTEVASGESAASRVSASVAADVDPTQAHRHTRAARGLATAFLIFVGACLGLPLLQTLYPVFGTVVAPVDEQRSPARFPALNLSWRTDGRFAAALNRWFGDRVGFRDLFIRTKNQIDFSLFSTSRKIYVGTDGWLFNRGNTGRAIAGSTPANSAGSRTASSRWRNG
jgi:hypothetical protein